MSNRRKVQYVYVVSDSAGETGESVVRAAIVQFLPTVIELKRRPFIHTPEGIDQIIKDAASCGGVIVFTLVIPQLRDYLLERATQSQVICIDLLGPIITSLEKALDQRSRHEPGIIHRLDEHYFRKVEAVEFAVRYDDGRDPTGVIKADIVLAGVSRTSKTPLAMFLAHKSYKVANVPLVPELVPPRELFTVNPSKIVGLTITPEKLNEIRKERLKALGLGEEAIYAKVQRINEELAHAQAIMKKLGCMVIDVSNKAVEETAGIIMERIPLR
ncbi:pyruvate, water dikinase regulatory protein [Paenibacillus sp. YN15]|uniref:pyruvate, water dikinase regulatory protein n=1 Tax=Paenibacillus sp. YN15 TaxID=1742774 RepID=UPI000DCBEAAE|nr:pyruvate, water dikinase regulatory protein [Paenibacillus sp. YN15]RAU99237.1 phosphoenolpyruvate synthase regulatory protein [Paenibacillus sp. YN15]